MNKTPRAIPPAAFALLKFLAGAPTWPTLQDMAKQMGVTHAGSANNYLYMLRRAGLVATGTVTPEGRLLLTTWKPHVRQMKSTDGQPLGAPNDEAMSFAEIGQELGVTRQRAQQIFASGLAKLVANESLTEFADLVPSRNCYVW